MNLYSILSMLSLTVYIFIGIYALILDKKSRVNKLFFVWCLSMSVWAFGYTFIYQLNDSGDTIQGYIWMKIAAIGWCSFSAIILHLTMLFTGNRNIEKKRVKILLYSPAVVFFATSLLFFRPDYTTPGFIEKFFYTGDFLYNFGYLLAGIYLMYVWGKNSDSFREKKQSQIICISSAIPFVISLIVQTLLPAIGIKTLPSLGQVYTVIMVIGIYYAIRRYRFFNVSTESLIDEILSNMMDLFILLSPKGKIIRVSKSTEELLKFEDGEIIGRKIDDIINDEVFLKNIYSGQNDVSVIKYERLNCKARDGSLIAISGTCSFIIDKYLKDVLGIAIVGHDIMLMQELEKEIDEHKETEKMLKESQERFIHLAYHDSLTDLPNRKYFYERLFIELKKAKRNNSKFAVFFLDLDGFKNVNDSYGHEMGDYLLCEVAGRIKGCIRQTDEAARIGGDEFTLLVTDIHSMEDAILVKEKIEASLDSPIIKGDISINTRASIGISMYPEDGEDMDTLMNKADNKMYLIKKSKR